jgi:hypothetical protein
VTVKPGKKQKKYQLQLLVSFHAIIGPYPIHYLNEKGIKGIWFYPEKIY